MRQLPTAAQAAFAVFSPFRAHAGALMPVPPSISCAQSTDSPRRHLLQLVVFLGYASIANLVASEILLDDAELIFTELP